MIAYRKASPALTHGKTAFISLPEPLLAFTRTPDGEQLTCVFNLSKDPQTVPMPKASAIAVGNAATLKGGKLVLEGNGFAYLT
jgi:alpha-glucosidase